VQSLFPTAPSELSDEDLAGLYAYPVERTWVRSNFVSTVDGSVQGADGRSGSISPRADQRLFALLRSLCDVILVGAGTARVEGYQPVQPTEVDAPLRRRLGLTELPAIAVVSRSLDLPEALLAEDGGPVLVVTTAAAQRSRPDAVPDHCETVLAGEEVVDMPTVVDQLSARGHQRMQCEGGPRLLRDLLDSGCCDELCVSIAPTAVAGPGHRMTEGAALQPPVPLVLRHVLEQDGSLFCRYTRMRG